MATVSSLNTTFYPSHRRFHYQVTAQDSNSELFRAIQRLHDAHNHVSQQMVDAVLPRATQTSTVYLFMNEPSHVQRSYVLTNQRGCAGVMWTRYVFSEPPFHEPLIIDAETAISS